MDFSDKFVADLDTIAKMPPEEVGPPAPDAMPDHSMTEQQLLDDPQFQHHARVMYEDYLKTGMGGRRGRNKVQGVSYALTEPRDIAEWAVGQVAFMNNNMTKMGADYSRLRNKSPYVLQSLMHVWDRYDSTPLTFGQFGRGLGQTFADPLTWLGLGAIGKVASKGLSKAAMKSHLRDVAKRAISNLLPTMAVGAAEGAAAMAEIGGVQEGLRSRAEEREFDWDVPMAHAGQGAVFGAGLGMAGPGLATGIKYTHKALKQRYRLFRGHTKNDMFQTQNPGGGLSFSETPDEAAQYGKKVTAVQVEPGSPTVMDLGNDAGTSFDRVIEQFNLSDGEIKVLAKDAGIKTEGLLVAEDLVKTVEFNEMMHKRGIDMIVYNKANWRNGTEEVTFHVLDPDIIRTARQQDLPVPLGQIPLNSAFSVAKSGASRGQVRAAQKEWLNKGFESKYFRRWSNDAPVVDGTGKSLEGKADIQFETGKPVVSKVYHGSDTGQINEFLDEKRGLNTMARSARQGHFFAGNPKTANHPLYTLGKDYKNPEVNSTVYEMYVKMDNPYVFDYAGSAYGDDMAPGYNSIISEAKRLGHDGAIIMNTTDGGPLDNVFVSFKTENIKSTMNTGLFDPMNRNVLYGTGAAAAPLMQGEEDDRN